MERESLRMERDIERVVIDRTAIAERVRALAESMGADLIARGGMDSEVTLVPVMSGSLVFTADLIRHMPMRMDIRLVALRSYPGKSIESSGAVTVLGELPTGLSGRHVIIIDDVLDSGRTISFIQRHVQSQGPASLRTCVLLKKRKSLPAPTAGAEYVGFEIDDEFVVGYGLDYDGLYRNWPDIVTLKAELL